MATRQRQREDEANALYERYGKPLEETHRGEFVAIAPSGEFFVASTALDAAESALRRFGPGCFLFKVGERIVWHWR